MELKYYVTSYTHSGMTREDSEDSCLVETGENGSAVIAVADGMGGFKASQFASSIAIEFGRDFFHSDSFKRLNLVNNDAAVLAAIKKLFLKINGAIIKAGESFGQKLSTTLTVGYIASRRIYLGHLGDSHAFRIRNEEIELLTINNNEQVAEILKRSNYLGSETAHEPECFQEMIQDGDTYLFCNDNLYRLLKPAEILGLIAGTSSLKEASDKILERARERSPDDNITAALLRVAEGPEPEPPPKPRASFMAPPKMFEEKPKKTVPMKKETPTEEKKSKKDLGAKILKELEPYKFSIVIIAIVLIVLAAVIIPKLKSEKQPAGKFGESSTPAVTSPQIDRETTEVVVVVGDFKHLKTLKANDTDIIQIIKEKNKYVYSIKEKANVFCELKPENFSDKYSIIVRFGDNREIFLKDVKTGKNQVVMDNDGVKVNLLRDFQFSTKELPGGRLQLKIENLQSPITLSVQGEPVSIKVKGR